MFLILEEHGGPADQLSTGEDEGAREWVGKEKGGGIEM